MIRRTIPTSDLSRCGPAPSNGARCSRIPRRPPHEPPAPLVWAVFLVLPLTAGTGTSPRERIREGNEHFAAGRYAEALEAYEQVPIEGRTPPDYLPELLHNRAAALFKLGRLDDARELWVRAAGLRDATFEAQMHYNTGNVHYAEALRSLGRAWEGQGPDPSSQQNQPPGGVGDAAAAARCLERAIERYRDALRLDPQLASARANLELAVRLRKLLEQYPPSSQPQSQPDPNRSQENDRQQPQSQSASQPSSQPSPGGEDREPQGDPHRQPPPDSQPQSSADESEAGEQQEPNQPAPDPNQLPEPDANQVEPREPEDDPNGVHMTMQEAERLLQLIRDAEKARREALRLRLRGPRPVEKDW